MAARIKGLQFLEALHHRDFRVLWTSTLLFTTARWMEIVVVGWLVLELTDSAFMVGLVGACRFLGLVLGPSIGAIADRMERRRLIILSQLAYISLMALLVAIIAGHQLETWHILVVTLLAGIAYAFDFPPRNALILDLVGQGPLLNAMALHRVAQDGMVFLGAIVGGTVLALGYSQALGLMVLTALASLLVLTRIRAPRSPLSSKEEPVWKDLLQGLRSFIQESTVRGPLLLAALANLLAFPLIFSLMPLFARDVLQVGPSGLGFLTGANGVGALLGSLILAFLSRYKRHGWLLIGGFISWPLILMLFALSTWYYLSLALMVIAGALQAISLATCATMLLSSVPDEMRGRVMGMRLLMALPMPLGSLLGGTLSAHWGAPLTVALFGALNALLAAGIALASPRLWRVK